MDHERATRLCWNITRRAIDGFDLEMLQTIFCLDAWACARSPISRALVDNFFPMLNLAGEPFTSTHELRDMLKMWQKLINESAGLKQVDNEDAGVLHYLARNGAAQYARSPGRSLVRAREKTDWISSEDDTADSPMQADGDDLDHTCPENREDDTSELSSEYSSDADELSNYGDEPSFENAYKEMIRTLFEQDVDVPYPELCGPLTISEEQMDLQGIHWKTALHYAIECKEPILAGVLLEKNVNCLLEDNNGLFPRELPGWAACKEMPCLVYVAHGRAVEQLRAFVEDEDEWNGLEEMDKVDVDNNAERLAKVAEGFEGLGMVEDG